MTDEEKKAIEYINKIVSDCENHWKQLGYTCNLYDGDEPIPVDAYKTVLNLIEKQQAEIRQYEKALHDQIIKDYDMELKLKAEIEKQDKIIDEMVYYLSDFDIDEMCEQCECCIGNGCHADDDVEFKMRCIKEYFKKKVENK